MIDQVDRLIALALEEDLGSAGDVTSQALVPADQQGRAELLAKEPLVLAGTDVARRVFQAVDPSIIVTFSALEGAALRDRQVFGAVTGPLRAILAGERTALNFLQRLSGVATHTARTVKALEGLPLKVLDTRKTTPGWRALEKAAVRAGGGTNHRVSLSDMVLIKDNHLRHVGSVAEAVRRARSRVRPGVRIEVEAANLLQVREALAAGADMIMLDNMPLETMRQAVGLAGGRVPLEASGNMTLDRVRSVAETGVDFISVGALTHSARAVDISLDFVH